MTVSGEGILRTYVINHRPMPGFAGEAPYVTAIVELAEGPRLMTNLVNVEPVPANLPVGLAVTVVFDDVTDTVTLPRFQPKDRR
ncbi:Zn-ribbon domain-containing OB-fold protein [Frankia nepalensis]|nr:OB-fold domain-containing protein [Frankia nepalensis]